MKVLVFARHPQGGIKTYFAYIYGNAVMRDLQLTLVTPTTDGAAFFAQRLGEDLHHVEAGGGNGQLLSTLLRVLRAEKPDILHSHGFTAGILAAVPARLLGVRHLVTTHDVFHQHQFSGVKGWLKKRLIGFFLGLADCINPVGEDACENLLAFYPRLGEAGKVVAIRNGIDTDFFSRPGVRALRGEIELGESALLVGYFGRFMAQKGFGLLVDLVERWNSEKPERPLHVACFGWGGFIREEQQALSRRGLSGYFHFFENTDDMPAALRGVDAVVMPSRWEACPLLAMEAMTSGAPLVASDCIGNREVTAGSPALIFRSGDVEDFQRALERFEANRPAIAGQAEAFMAEAREQFDVNRTAQQLRQLYHSL